MAKLSVSFQLSHDIDLFCKIGSSYCHFATNGGLIPDIINDRKYLGNTKQFILQELHEIVTDEDIYINEEYVTKRVNYSYSHWNQELGMDFKKEYLRSFLEMARKGFLSYDRDIIPENYQRNSSGDIYILIAKPINHSCHEKIHNLLMSFSNKPFGEQGEVVFINEINQSNITTDESN